MSDEVKTYTAEELSQAARDMEPRLILNDQEIQFAWLVLHAAAGLLAKDDDLTEAELRTVEFARAVASGFKDA